MKTNSVNDAILRTLLYSDIFDYPLSEDEIWSYLILRGKTDREIFKRSVAKINSVVKRRGKYLFVEGREENVGLRINKFSESRKKLIIAQDVSKKIFLIPSILFIGISGNLSMMNSGREDDIDLFVITRTKTLWVTRFLMILILKMMRMHRRRNDKKYSNKICLNMLVDQGNIALPHGIRNIYTAHEVVQVKPIIARGDTFEKFVKSNLWISFFMPNAVEVMRNRKIIKVRDRLTDNILFFLLSFLEIPARTLQKIYIKRNLTSETIGDGFIAFHPRDYNSMTLKKYRQNLVRYKLKSYV